MYYKKYNCIFPQDSRDFRDFSLKEKLRDEKYEEARDTMVEVRLT